MSRTSHRPAALTGRINTALAIGLSASLIALLAAIPTSSASAAKGIEPNVSIPVGNLGPVLSGVPLTGLGLSPTELEKLVSEQGGGVLGSLLSRLLGNPNATVGELLNLGVEPGQLLNGLSPTELDTLLERVLSGVNGEGLSKVLSPLAGNLTGEELTSLKSIIAALTGALSPTELSKLQENLTTLFSSLSKGELEPVLQRLEQLLGAGNLPQLEGLLNELKSHIPPELRTQIEKLLQGLDASQLSEVLGALLGKVNDSQLETLLHDLLGGVPLSPTDVGSIAGELGTSTQAIGEDLGSSVQSSTPAVSAVLGSEGPVLGLVSDLGGLKLGLLGPENGKGGNGGNGGNGNSSGENSSQGGANGGKGGSGGSSTSPSGSGETINVILPTAQGSSAKAGAAAKAIKILSHKVKGKVATIVVQVPSAGKVTLTGAHVTKASHSVGKTERLTLKVKLTKAGASSLRRHKNLLRVVLTASFKPTQGASSSATTSVRFV